MFPTLQMGPFNVRQDQRVTKRILEEATEATAIKFGTGYFNLTEEYMESLLQRGRAKFDLLMAHPKVNKETFSRVVFIFFSST